MNILHMHAHMQRNQVDGVPFACLFACRHACLPAGLPARFKASDKRFRRIVRKSTQHQNINFLLFIGLAHSRPRVTLLFYYVTWACSTHAFFLYIQIIGLRRQIIGTRPRWRAAAEVPNSLGIDQSVSRGRRQTSKSSVLPHAAKIHRAKTSVEPATKNQQKS